MRGLVFLLEQKFSWRFKFKTISKRNQFYYFGLQRPPTLFFQSILAWLAEGCIKAYSLNSKFDKSLSSTSAQVPIFVLRHLNDSSRVSSRILVFGISNKLPGSDVSHYQSAYFLETWVFESVLIAKSHWILKISEGICYGDGQKQLFLEDEILVETQNLETVGGLILINEESSKEKNWGEGKPYIKEFKRPSEESYKESFGILGEQV